MKMLAERRLGCLELLNALQCLALKRLTATENKREMLMRRACARALSTRSFLLLEHRLQPTPSPLCGLASWPLLNACSMFPGEQFLT